MRRRSVSELPPEDIWECVGGCTKKYKKTSLHSIGRHKAMCPYWLKRHPKKASMAPHDILDRLVGFSRASSASSVDFNLIFSTVPWPGLGRFVADPCRNVCWVDDNAIKVLRLLPVQRRYNWTDVFYNAIDQKTLFADIMLRYSRRSAGTVPYVDRNGRMIQVNLHCVSSSSYTYLLGVVNDTNTAVEAYLRITKKIPSVQGQPKEYSPSPNSSPARNLRETYGIGGQPQPQPQASFNGTYQTHTRHHYGTPESSPRSMGMHSHHPFNAESSPRALGMHPNTATTEGSPRSLGMRRQPHFAPVNNPFAHLTGRDEKSSRRFHLKHHASPQARRWSTPSSGSAFQRVQAQPKEPESRNSGSMSGSISSSSSRFQKRASRNSVSSSGSGIQQRSSLPAAFDSASNLVNLEEDPITPEMKSNQKEYDSGAARRLRMASMEQDN